MKSHTNIATVVFLSLAAAVAQSNGAQAGCKVGTSSDSSQDTCIGSGALNSNTTGWGNSAFGSATLYSNTTGYGNSGFGNGVLSTTTTGDYNTGAGYDALYFNSTGGYNTGIGSYALYYSTTGNRNTAVGAAALLTNTTGYKTQPTELALSIRIRQAPRIPQVAQAPFITAQRVPTTLLSVSRQARC